MCSVREKQKSSQHIEECAESEHQGEWHGVNRETFGKFSAGFRGYHTYRTQADQYGTKENRWVNPHEYRHYRALFHFHISAGNLLRGCYARGARQSTKLVRFVHDCSSYPVCISLDLPPNA